MFEIGDYITPKPKLVYIRYNYCVLIVTELCNDGYVKCKIRAHEWSNDFTSEFKIPIEDFIKIEWEV